MNNMNNKTKIQPLTDRVIIKIAEIETKTKSGIIIPNSATTKPLKGEIIAVGTGGNDKPLTVKVGDKVLYNKYGGIEISIDNIDFLIIKEDDILAIIS